MKGAGEIKEIRFISSCDLLWNHEQLAISLNQCRRRESGKYLKIALI